MITSRENYKELFNNVLGLIHKSQIVSLFSYEIFDSFPNKIGNELRNDFDNEIIYSLKERDLFYQGKNHEEIIEIIGERTHSILNGMFLSYPFYQIQKIANQDKYSHREIAGIGNSKLLIGAIDFESTISEKQLVYLVGLIEGFILDSVRILYYHKEEYIETHEIKPLFSELKMLTNFEELKIERIINITEFKWSNGSFSERFKKLQTKFRIDLDFHPKLQAKFDEANLLRNCILHNGAKASKNYYSAIGVTKGLNVGDPIRIDKYFNEAMYYLSIDLINKLFYIVDSYSFQGHSDQSQVDEPVSYFKDVMLDSENWIFNRLTKQGIY